ncbi:MAG: metallophosphoesterase [Planctomycetota bacterium]
MRRRDVIKGGAAVAAGLALTGPATRAKAEPQDSDEPWVALLSDTHIDADPGRQVRGVNMAENLSAVIKRLHAAESKPQGILINGDIARDEGRNGDYAVLNRRLEALQNLRPHTHVVPGNHDHRGNMIDAGLFHADEGAVENKSCRRLSFGGADWYLLDSLRYVDEVAGSLGSEQIDWLAAQLDAAPADRPAMVLTHHQPEDPQDPDDDGFGLADGAALLDMLRERKQVKAIFHGHRHAWAVRETHGIHIVGLPATSYVFAEGETAGYVEARVRPDHLQLTRRCVDPQDPAEGQTHRLGYR